MGGRLMPKSLAGSSRNTHGLAQALADGRFDQLFAKYFAEDIAALKLHKRRVLKLSNPLFPADAIADGPEVWPLLSNPVSVLTDER